MYILCDKITIIEINKKRIKERGEVTLNLGKFDFEQIKAMGKYEEINGNVIIAGEYECGTCRSD